MVEKPWSAVTTMSVVSARPSSARAARRRPRLSSALRMPASEVGPSMPGHELVQAVARVVLRAVRVARPVDHQERLLALGQHRQDHPRRDRGEIVLLGHVGRARARRRGVAGLAVVAPRRRRRRQAHGGQALHHLRRRAGCPSRCRWRRRRRSSARRCGRCGRRSGSGRACPPRPCRSPCRGRASACVGSSR